MSGCTSSCRCSASRGDYELPVSYTGDVAYHREKWSIFTEASRGFQGNNFLAGLEYRLGPVELRGRADIRKGSGIRQAGQESTSRAALAWTPRSSARAPSSRNTHSGWPSPFASTRGIPMSEV